ncbi:hypothetical protein ABEB36_005130 [Hypothenemus hampei]|uniref:Ammonium transporter AmtB-like domain-containing protein n=1 Tax=Hypothenemus hampei TaxID=57062 RepID=A0ABD1EX36_HYPHA
MGAVLGRISHTQLIVMGILEIVGYCFNDTLNSKYIKAVDNGGSIVLHTFGAYYGLAISYVSGKKQATSPNAILNNNPPESSYISNVLAMIGTLFLWVYWPSFNSIEMENDKNHRAVINTYLSLAASCVITFAASQFSSKEHKFSMTHVQNATLAGGVAIGACAQLMIQPFGAILIGIIAGLLSVYGYTKYSKFLETYGIKDTCGVHNLHGLPGILGGIAASVLASIASEQQYGKTLYEVYPARATPVIELTPEYIPLDARNGRSAGEQAGYQALIIIVTLATALTTGLISGFILNLNLWNDMVMESYYDDSIFWEVPNDKLYSESLAPFKWKLHEKLYDKNPSKISII